MDLHGLGSFSPSIIIIRFTGRVTMSRGIFHAEQAVVSYRKVSRFSASNFLERTGFRFLANSRKFRQAPRWPTLALSADRCGCSFCGFLQHPGPGFYYLANNSNNKKLVFRFDNEDRNVLPFMCNEIVLIC